MKVLDAEGREIVAGDRVRSTGAETPFVHTQNGEVVEFRTGPPVVGVCWDSLSRSLRPYWHSVDLMWRCPDLLLLDSDTTKGSDADAA